MNVNEFNDDYLNKPLHKVAKENKTIFLHCDSHPPTNEFTDSLFSHYFLPHITECAIINSSS